MRFIIEIEKSPTGFKACVVESGMDQPGEIEHVRKEENLYWSIRSTLSNIEWEEDRRWSDNDCGQDLGEALMRKVAFYEELVNGSTPPNCQQECHTIGVLPVEVDEPGMRFV